MTKYSFGFYRLHTRLEGHIIRTTLSALHELNLGFFPATLTAELQSTIPLDVPDAFDESWLHDSTDAGPHAYSIACENGTSLEFTLSLEPSLIPPSLLCQFSDDVLARNAWSIETLLLVARAVINSFAPDYGYLFDDAHALRPEYLTRMFRFDRRRVPSGVYWVNYFGPEWVSSNIGRSQLDRIRSLVPIFEDLSTGGVLIAIQTTPYQEGDPSHRGLQEKLEQRVGLPAIHEKYSNPGL